MVKKILGGLLCLIVLVVTVAGVNIGTHFYFKKADEKAATVKHGADDVIVEDPKAPEPIFVSLPEVVITLQGPNEHYMLTEIVLEAKDIKAQERLNSMLPLLQSITVNSLSNEDYEHLRQKKISDLRIELDNAFKQEFKNRKMNVPYKTLLLKRVIFQ